MSAMTSRMKLKNMKSKNYKHLQSNNLPWLIARGIELIGTREIVGKEHNPDIIQWGVDVGLGKIYTNDEIPWCGLYVAKVCQLAKKEIVKNPLWARNWAKWGNKSNVASLGDILVFKRGSGGHVGFYVGEDKTCYHVLGGNQSNRVNITRISKSRILAVRRAKYRNQPKMVKPFHVSPTGAVSKNEA